jgi:hypothetical protein
VLVVSVVVFVGVGMGVLCLLHPAQAINIDKNMVVIISLLVLIFMFTDPLIVLVKIYTVI